MTSIPRRSLSYWIASSHAPEHPKLERDLDVDVAIVGGGITGLTTGLLLQRAGKRVVVLEAHKIAQGVTGHTTAHLTEVLDSRYSMLSFDFGLDGAKLAAEASRAAIEWIGKQIAQKSIECGWRRVPGYLYSENEDELDSLHREYDAAKKLGLEVELTREVPLPFKTAAGIRFANQAEFHVRDYLLPLCAELARGGGVLFEDTRVLDIEEEEMGPCRVITSGGIVRAAQVVVAANVPLNKLFLQTKLANYRSYALAARVAQPALPGLFWDTQNPYHYLRSSAASQGSVLLVGGEDHKTGNEDHAEERFERLLAYTKERFTVEEVSFRWSAQIVQTGDGLPLIGRNSLSDRVFVATGYNGNGITFGTAAGMLLSDLVLAKKNPWAELFDSTRVKPIVGAKEFIVDNAVAGLHFLADKILPADASSVSEVAPGEGKIVSVNGKKVAVFREPNGMLCAVSATCTHLGCQVHFNDAEKSWDCPCDGSRFNLKGEVLNGPATLGLTAVHVTDPPRLGRDARLATRKTSH